MKGNQHVYECQVQIDQKLCVCGMYKECKCKHDRKEHSSRGCLGMIQSTDGESQYLCDCLRPAMAWPRGEVKTHRIEPLKITVEGVPNDMLDGVMLGKYMIEKVNEIINHLNSKPEN